MSYDYASERKRLQQAAQEWQRNVRSYLQDTLRVGRANVIDPLGMSTRNLDQGGVNFRFGVNPTDQQVQQFINQQGGNPYTRALMRLGRPSRRKKIKAKQVANEAMRAGVEAQGQLAKFLEDAQGKFDEANDANKERYADILQRLEDRYARNMERVENWGKVAETEAREAAKESIGAIQANLSARGLGNSTITEAFRQRNDRNLNTQMQRISEARDQRALQTDAQLSKDVTDFMERRTDRGPDYGQLMQLAQQYGLGNAGQGFNQGQGQGGPQYQPAQQAPQIPAGGGISPQQAMGIAAQNAAQFNFGMPQYGYMPPMQARYSGPRMTREAMQRLPQRTAASAVANPIAPVAIGAGAVGGMAGMLPGLALGMMDYNQYNNPPLIQEL